MVEPARLRRPLTALLITALMLGVGLLLPRWWQRVRTMPPWPVAAVRLQRAQAALPQLAVVSPRSLEEYEREFFGPAWTDVDGNGCDTRNDLLATWLRDPLLSATKPCVVLAGTLADPYTGHLIHFERGPSTSRAIEIDHVVALADAWRKGAWQWPASLALHFANDPANLIPVDGPTNQDKGAADATTWLPPNEGFHCAYAVVQVLVKDAYGIGVSGAELEALRAVLDTCEPAPTPGGPTGATSWPLQEGIRACARGVARRRHGSCRRCRWCRLGSPCVRPSRAGAHRFDWLEEIADVPSGRHTRLQRERPHPGPGLRVRTVEPAGRETRAPPAAAGQRPDARTCRTPR